MKNFKRLFQIGAFMLFNIIMNAQIGTPPLLPDSTLLPENRAKCGFDPKMLRDPELRLVPGTGATPSAMPVTSYPPSAIFNCGRFQLYYEDVALGTGDGFDAGAGLGAMRRNTLCLVYQYIESVFDFSSIPPGDPIKIEIQQTPPASSVTFLAAAGPVYPGATSPGIYNGSVLNHNLPPYSSPVPALFDGTLIVNFNTYNFYSDIPLPVPNCTYDLFGVCLHEVGHQMGFLSLLIEDGFNNPVSSFGSDQYSLFDWQNIHHGDINFPLTFEKLVTGTLAAPQINPLITSPTNYLRDEKLWLNNNGRFLNNLPIYSGIYLPSYPGFGFLTIGSVASHIDGEYVSFTKRFSLSPGFMKKHSMQPYFDFGELRREFTEQEIRIFLQLGYTLNPIYAASTTINGVNTNASIINTNNTPYTTKQVTSLSCCGAAQMSYPDLVQPADFTISNNGVPLVINLAADATLFDLDGDPITVQNNTLYNIRGCGNGNNSNQITVAGGNMITFTPRTDFIGRAQFGFYLFDGKERGSYMVYTIDVTNGPSFVNIPNSNTPPLTTELIINGNYEQGMEIRRNSSLAEEAIPNSSLDVNREEGLYFTGDQLGDAHPLQYVNWPWTSSNGIIIGNSQKECSNPTTPGRFGSKPFSFPNIWNHPAPVAGYRYSFIFGSHNYNAISTPLALCTRYIATFDVNFANTGLVVGSIFNFNLHVNNALSYPTNVATQVIPVSIVVGTGWQTITVPFNYCSSTPGNYLNFVSTSPKRVYYDNVSLVLDPSPTPPLVVNITNSTPSYCLGSGSSSTLSAVVTDGLCNLTYSWSPGGATTSSITVSPALTTTYTVTVNDGCRTSTATSTVTVNPLPVVTFGAITPNACSGGPAVTLTTGSPAGGTYSGPFVSAGVFTPPTVTTSTSYTLTYTYTDVNGCANSANQTITVDVCAGPCGTCTLTLDALASAGNLSVNPPAGQNYCLLNNITITAPVIIALSEVKIAPGVTITVVSGASLTLTGSHLYACTDMWQGIVVKPGGTVKTQNFVLGPWINKSTMIEDAFVAIDVLAGSPVTSNLLSITNTTFNRNLIGIRIDGYGPALTTYPFTIVSSVITSRAIAFSPGLFNWPHTNAIKATYAVFNPLQTPYINDGIYQDLVTAAYLKPPFLPGTTKPRAGIILNKVGQTINPATIPTYYEIKIGTTLASNNNVFDNLGIGIDALNSNFTCVNNIFQRTISPQKNTAAINAVAQEIFNCRLQVIPATGTSFINKFYDCNISVNATNYFEVNAKYCEVYSLQNFSTQYGLAHRGQNGFILNTNRYIAINLSNNTFSNIEFAVSFLTNNSFYSVGPWTSGSGQYSGQVDINQNLFRPFVPGFPLANTYLDRAITASNVTGTTHFISPTQTVNTNSNTVNNVFRGIRCNNWQKKSVISNSNTVSLIPVPGSPGAIQYGISHANNIPMNPLSNNIISNVVSGYGIANLSLVGIATQLCNNQVVNCNTTRNVTMGIYFAGNEMPTVFKYNVFDNSGINRHKYAYVLDNSGFIGQQGAAGSPSDNRWTPAANWTPGVHFKTATMNGSYAWNGSSGSPLWVRGTPAVYNPAGVGFNTSLFPTLFINEYNVPGAINPTSPSGPTPFPCPLIPHIAILSPGLIVSMEKIARDEVAYTVNSEATKIIGKNQLYRLLKNDPSYMSGSVDLQNFYLQSQTTYREQFSGIEEDMILNDFAAAQGKIASLALESNIEINYKDFYNLYIKQQTDSLVNDDSILLYAIASGCPFTDGAIVYQARSMYNSVYDVNKDFVDLCINVEDRSALIARETEHSFDADIFPNPSTGEVFINPKGLMNETMEINVKDVNGKTVYSQSLQLTNGMSNFKLDISNGVYFVHITNAKNHETIVKKLVIQK